MPRRTVHDLVTDLDALAADAGFDAVLELVADPDLDVDSLRPFVGPRDDRYARRLVHRSPRFDVIVLTWRPGQATPIHNHAGNCGWVRLVRGRVVEDRFGLAPSSRASGADVAADLPRAGAAALGRVELVAAGSIVVAEPGAVATVDRERAIHRIGNPRAHADDEVAVTLHVYSRPHDVCLVFDPERKTCGRREMAFDAAPD